MIWVYSITKAPINFSNNIFELLKYYKEQKGLAAGYSLWKCYSCKKEHREFGASFVVDVHSEDRNLYLIPICLDCLKQLIKSPENPKIFQVYKDDLLCISKYNPSSKFVDISIEESQFSIFIITYIPWIDISHIKFSIGVSSITLISNF